MNAVSSATLKVAQISDSHVLADPAQRLNAVDTLATLQQVFRAVSDTQPDIIVLTGDLVEKPQPAAYQRVVEVLQQSSIPIYCLPGNHDQIDVLRLSLASSAAHLCSSLITSHWQLLFLDSCAIPNTHSGQLSEQELQQLEQNLSAHPELPAFVFLHHHPVPIGSEWMDGMRLNNADDLFAVVDAHPQVKAMAWGHIHQQFEAQRNGVQLMGAPSSCVQFKPASQAFTLDELNPGYRLLSLHADGSIDTQVCYL